MSVDLTLKLSGMVALAYEFVGNGWNVLCKFNEKRPKGTNPAYAGNLGILANLINKQDDSKLTNVLEVVFFPALDKSTDGYEEHTVLDRGSYTVKGFSKFFRQAAYEEIKNSQRQARLDGSLIYKNKLSDALNDNDFQVIQKENAHKNVRKAEESLAHPGYFKGTKDDNYKSIGDIENGPAPEKIDLESVYPMRYILKNNQWVPQVVFNHANYYKPLQGIPSRTEPKKLGNVVPVVSGEQASISGVWNPVNANNFSTCGLRVNKGKELEFFPGKIYKKPIQQWSEGFEEKETPLEQLKKDYEEFEQAELDKRVGKVRPIKINIPSTSFNPPKIVQK